MLSYVVDHPFLELSMDSAIDFAAEKALDGLLEVAKIIFSSKSEGIELKKNLLPLKDAIYEVS